ncbi:MAG TPA: hypothetical protein VIS07_16835 [Candidatus Binatia bacterium]
MAGFVALPLGLLWLARQIPPRPVDREVELWRGAERSLLPFGRQPTEPVDAESARVGRPF